MDGVIALLLNAQHRKEVEEEWSGERDWDPLSVKVRGQCLMEDIARVERGELFTEEQSEEYEGDLARAIERPAFFGLDEPPEPPSRSPELEHKNATYATATRWISSEARGKHPVDLIRVAPDTLRSCLSIGPTEGGQREMQIHPEDWSELLAKADTMPLLDLSGPEKRIAGVPVVEGYRPAIQI